MIKGSIGGPSVMLVRNFLTKYVKTQVVEMTLKAHSRWWYQENSIEFLLDSCLLLIQCEPGLCTV